MPYVNQKLQATRERISAQTPLAFSLHFLFRCEQNLHYNLTLKIMKMCEQIFEKNTAPKHNLNSLNLKNQENANYSPSYCFEAIKNHYQLL